MSRVNKALIGRKKGKIMWNKQDEFGRSLKEAIHGPHAAFQLCMQSGQTGPNMSIVDKYTDLSP